MSDLHGYALEELSVGMSASYQKTVSDADITLFAGVSGDTNPIHLSDDYAGDTMFEGRIAHGMLSASYISTVIGTKLPGPGCVYMSQSLRFTAPVRPGDTVTATATITDINVAKKRVSLACVCSVAGKPVLTGDAVVMIP